MVAETRGAGSVKHVESIEEPRCPKFNLTQIRLAVHGKTLVRARLVRRLRSP
jgi:hypothetical protein